MRGTTWERRSRVLELRKLGTSVSREELEAGTDPEGWSRRPGRSWGHPLEAGTRLKTWSIARDIGRKIGSWVRCLWDLMAAEGRPGTAVQKAGSSCDEAMTGKNVREARERMEQSHGRHHPLLGRRRGRPRNWDEAAGRHDAEKEEAGKKLLWDSEENPTASGEDVKRRDVP